MRIRAPLVVAAVAVLWGTIGPIVREVELPAVAVVAARVWIAAAGLGAWLVLRRGRLGGTPLLRYRPGRSLANGALLALHWVAMVAALQRAPVGTVMLLVYLAPVGIAAVAPWALGERVPAGTVVAVAVGLAGTALLARPSVDSDAAGIALALVAAALYVVLVVISKPLAAAYGGPRLAFQQMAVAGLVLLPFAVGAGWGRPRAAWTWLVALGLVHTAAAIALFLGALAVLPAAQVGALAYLEPVSAVGFGWLLLDESPGAATVVGGALVILAGALVLRDGSPAPATSPEVAGVPR